MQTSFTIGDLAREFKVTLRTLRFYEDKALLSPRRSGQARIYGRRDRARLRWILLGRKVGFSLDEIREMLELTELRDGHTPQLEIARARFSAAIEGLQQRKQEIEQAISELSRSADIVSGMLRARAVGDAPFLEAAE